MRQKKDGSENQWYMVKRIRFNKSRSWSLGRLINRSRALARMPIQKNKNEENGRNTKFKQEAATLQHSEWQKLAR